MYKCMYVCMYVCMNVQMSTSMHAVMNACICRCVYACMPMYVCLLARMYAHMHGRMHVHVCIYTHIHSWAPMCICRCLTHHVQYRRRELQINFLTSVSGLTLTKAKLGWLSFVKGFGDIQELAGSDTPGSTVPGCQSGSLRGWFTGVSRNLNHESQVKLLQVQARPRTAMPP